MQPGSGTTLQGSVSLRAETAGIGVVAGVRFTVDGQAVGVEDTLAPYKLSWNCNDGSQWRACPGGGAAGGGRPLDHVGAGLDLGRERGFRHDEAERLPDQSIVGSRFRIRRGFGLSE